MANAFNPVNELEKMLMSAATKPEARPTFFRLLLDSILYTLTPEPTPEGARTLQTGERVAICNFSDRTGDFVPLFTSHERLQEVVNQGTQTFGTLGIKGKEMMDILRQRTCRAILNPGCAYGKVLLSNEIQALADGSFFGPMKREVLTAPRKVMIGQPARYPTKLVESLKSLFETKIEVEAAYLAFIAFTDTAEPPHCVVGLRVTANRDRVVADAGLVARDCLDPGEFVDFVEIGEDGVGLNGYFGRNCPPFYEKANSPQNR